MKSMDRYAALTVLFWPASDPTDPIEVSKITFATPVKIRNEEKIGLKHYKHLRGRKIRRGQESF